MLDLGHKKMVSLDHKKKLRYSGGPGKAKGVEGICTPVCYRCSKDTGEEWARGQASSNCPSDKSVLLSVFSISCIFMGQPALLIPMIPRLV